MCRRTFSQWAALELGWESQVHSELPLRCFEWAPPALKQLGRSQGWLEPVSKRMLWAVRQVSRRIFDNINVPCAYLGNHANDLVGLFDAILFNRTAIGQYLPCESISILSAHE